MNSQMHQILLKRVIGVLGVVATGVSIALPVAATNLPKPMRQAEAKPILEGPVSNQVSDNSAPATTGTLAPTTAPAATTPATTPAVTTPAPGTAETMTPAAPAMPAVIHQLPNRSTGTPSTSSTPSTTGTAEAQTPAPAPSSTTPAAQTPASPSTPATTTATSNTIVQVAASNEKFKTLVSALTEAELTQVLQGEGPFTVFAPTDDAFAKLPEGTLEELLKPENRSTLIKVLTYHVVPGKVTAEQLSAGQVRTVEGSPLTVAIQDGKVTVNSANVVQTDIMASNGVIHVVDKVILPEGL